MEALQQRFSRAPAWGQNVSYGGEGSDSTQAMLAPSEAVQLKNGPARKSGRVWRPNLTVMGPEWSVR
jgi:hypothetical protein